MTYIHHSELYEHQVKMFDRQVFLYLRGGGGISVRSYIRDLLDFGVDFTW